jgi:large-conductance mechanosensitive channel
MITKFLDYIKSDDAKYNIIITIFAAIFSELLTSFASNIIIPLIDGDLNKDNKKDINNNIKNYKVTLFGKELLLGEFAYSFIKFIFIVFILYLFSKVY